LQFLYPNVLFFMLIPAFFLLFFIAKKKDLFSTYFSEEILTKLSVSNRYFSNKARNVTLVLALIFMLIALSRPVTNEKEHKSKQELNSIVIALDISKSMLATDIYPNRLTLAKKKVLDIIDNSKDSAIAIVLFAKKSFIISPLSQDYNSLKTLVKNIDTGVNFDNGTNIYSTLEITNKLLRNAKNKNLILLSDGADKSNFQEEINFANKNNINIYTLALATKKGSPIKVKDNEYLTNNQGQIITVKLNENIKELSLQTNGGYITFSTSKDDINAILKDITSKSKKNEFEAKKIKTYTELFYYPLALAIVLLLIAFSSLPKLKNFRKTSANILILALTLCFTKDLQASVFDFKHIEEANKHYDKQNFKEAQKEYEKINDSIQKEYNIANSLYKQGKYKEAEKKYQNIKTEDRDLNFNRLHNLGNSQAKAGKYEEAIKSYEEALKIKNENQTKENLETIKKALENKKQKQENNQNQNSKDKQQKKQEKKSNKEKNQKNNNSQQNNSSKDKDKNEKKEEEQKENSQKTNDKKNEKEKSNESQINKKSNDKFISDNEEKKWLKQLDNQKAKTLMKEVESSKEDNSSNPW